MKMFAPLRPLTITNTLRLKKKPITNRIKINVNNIYTCKHISKYAIQFYHLFVLFYVKRSVRNIFPEPYIRSICFPRKPGYLSSTHVHDVVT